VLNPGAIRSRPVDCRDTGEDDLAAGPAWIEDDPITARPEDNTANNNRWKILRPVRPQPSQEQRQESDANQRTAEREAGEVGNHWVLLGAVLGLSAFWRRR
jgi:hypothetical protein